MSISIEEVERIAKLARLSITEQEKQKLQQELSSILDYVDQLKEVQDQASGFKDELQSINLMRDDVVEEVVDPAQFVAQAPDKEGNFIKVKSILD